MDKERLHFHISIHKSLWRMVGYGLIVVAPWYAILILLVSELLGIAEEVWGA